MGDITETENKFLNELVKDCITYRLTESEALEYVKTRFHAISEASYKRRKARLLSDGNTQLWLSDFTRIGFVSNHKQDIEAIRKIRDDSIHQLQIEIAKKSRDEYKILKLKADIRDNTQLLSELNLGTPIISAIRAKLSSSDRASLAKENGPQTLQISK